MTPGRWQQVEELYQEALERPPEDRAALLAQVDPELRREVEQLLAKAETPTLLEAPAETRTLSLAETASLRHPPAQFGPYRVVSLLGKGGMGEVYRAHDSKLGRDVAVKTLPAEVATDPGRLSRFRREARTLASLNHPGIAAIYGLEESEGNSFLVLEIVEGETLAERIKRIGPLPLNEALRIAGQVAEALQAAHAKGITHRDIKPANIKITPEGRVKVLDFGLAKSILKLPKGVRSSNLETLTLATAAGQIVGTPSYMSPEQARGESVDERTDIWAFGCVLYELLAGLRAFQGESLPDLITAVMSREPDWRRLPSATPERVRALLRKCLEKDPAQRPASISDARAAIELVQAGRRGVSRRTIAAASALGLAAVLSVPVAFNLGGIRDRLTDLAAGPRIRSIAVLPLRNASGDPAQEYFSDGMTESLIASLAKLGSIKVISRTSAMRYKSSDKPLPLIASELGVNGILEGSVGRSAGHLLIDVTLFDGKTGLSLWGDSYDRELADALIVESDISRDIARQIRVQLTPADESRLADVRSVDPEAHDLYVRGVSYATQLTPTGLDTAMQYFEQAREKDAALGWAGISFVWLTRMQFGFTSASKAAPQARAAALEALKRDPNLPEIHLVLGILKSRVDWDWDGARKEFERALELNPNDAEAYAQWASVENILGNMTRAPELGEKSLQLEPFRPIFRGMHARQLANAGRYAEALSMIREVVKQQPSFDRIALDTTCVILYGLHRYEDLFREIRSRYDTDGDVDVVQAMDSGYAESGYQRGLELGGDVLAARAEKKFVNPESIALFYRYAGDEEHMLDWIERMLDQRNPNTPSAVRLDVPGGVRKNPRFQAIRRRMMLPAG
jgi:TolB-like protein